MYAGIYRTGKFKVLGSGVYKLPYKRCPQVYVGKSGRSLDVRLNEHKQAVTQGNISNALFLHMSENSHQINWQGAELLIREKIPRNEKILNMLLLIPAPK